MPFTARAIANRFLNIAAEREQPVSPMKLQKLLYYSQGWTLALTGELLFNEQIEAWKWGPVVRTVYGEFREFGNSPIDRLAIVLDKRGDGFALISPSIDDQNATPEQIELAKALTTKVWDVYGGYTAIQLSNMTHEAGTPWDEVMKQYNGAPPKGTDIPAERIASYFKAMTGDA
jgi:uncharacterized phage-associated protein